MHLQPDRFDDQVELLAKTGKSSPVSPETDFGLEAAANRTLTPLRAHLRTDVVLPLQQQQGRLHAHRLRARDHMHLARIQQQLAHLGAVLVHAGRGVLGRVVTAPP